ncbi:hypothetical protein EDB85DRAFT_1942564 [Lactarius pseudohatsudake]|nr:hypothetical protein EDB85DRAFT_1942564 [Lactarius pseudohatsudake]
MADSPVGRIYEKLASVTWTYAYPWTDDEVLTWVSIHWFSCGARSVPSGSTMSSRKRGKWSVSPRRPFRSAYPASRRTSSSSPECASLLCGLFGTGDEGEHLVACTGKGHV